MHGDVFDMVVKHARWLALLGDTAYDFAILVNRYFNALRRRLGFSYWSLSQWAKHKVKNAVNYIGAFEQTLAAEARAPPRRRRHLRPHPPRRHPRRFRHPLRQCGDWVESCTAVAEHADGHLEIIRWTGEEERAKLLAASPHLAIEDDTEIAA